MERNTWRGTHNIDLTATKYKDVFEAELEERARRYLSGFLLSLEDEQILLDTWIMEFQKQYLRCKPAK
jgi:hypothetical protein